MEDIIDPWNGINWSNVGRNTIAQLPKHEQNLFIRWLEDNPGKLMVYEDSPGEALRMWKDSVQRYSLYGVDNKG